MKVQLLNYIIKEGMVEKKEKKIKFYNNGMYLENYL